MDRKSAPRASLLPRYPHVPTVGSSFTRMVLRLVSPLLRPHGPTFGMLPHRSSAALPPRFLRSSSASPAASYVTHRFFTVPTRFPLFGTGNGRRGGGYCKTLRGKRMKSGGSVEEERQKNGMVTLGRREKVGEGGPTREAVLRACTQGRWEKVGVSDPSKSRKSFEKQISR